MSRPSGAPVRSDATGGTPVHFWLVLPALVACTWVALLLVTPRWRNDASRGRATIAALVDLGAARICHRQASRSFHWHGEPWPVCGRCTGLYMAGATGLMAAALAAGRPRRPAVAVARPWRRDARAMWLVLAGLPTLGTWALETAGVWNPGTPLRALAALPLGATVGWIVGVALARSGRRA